MTSEQTMGSDVLSLEEMEALFLFAYGDGKTPAEIAPRVGVPEEEVEARLWSAAEKLGVTALSDLKERLYDLEWIKRPEA